MISLLMILTIYVMYLDICVPQIVIFVSILNDSFHHSLVLSFKSRQALVHNESSDHSWKEHVVSVQASDTLA